MNETEYRVLCASVDTAIKLKGPSHFFRFKGFALKYTVSQSEQWTDCITICYPLGECSCNKAYEIITEFLSLWSFEVDEPIIPGRCITAGTPFPTEESALKAKITTQERVRVPKTTSCDTILYLPKIETEDQGKSVRLYRQARSCINVYSQVLFFWHTLVYPSRNDKGAQYYIQKFTDDKIDGYSHVYKDIKLLIKDKTGVFSEELCESNFGKYIRDNVRHAIAHIVMKRGRSLEIDNIDQQAHIGMISRILRYIARYKIQNEHGLSLKKPHGTDYFMTLKNPDSE